MHIPKKYSNSATNTVVKITVPPVLSEPLKINLLTVDNKIDVLNIKNDNITANMNIYNDDLFKKHLILNLW